ncbi:MAG: STAS domain-containing protein [Isosphaeraceae bacterium]|nr:STAS domain-containing protein [Isosphaeraceae bacterium]
MSIGDEAAINTVVLSGPATLYESAELRETLLAAVFEDKPLRIDLETSGPWDIAGLQLLVSALTSARLTGQTVRLVNVPRVCAEIATRSGLSEWLKGAAESFL